MTRTPLLSPLLPVACAVLLLAAPAHAMDLTVTIQGVDPARGAVRLALFDSAETFDAAPSSQDKAPVALRLVPGGPVLSVALTGLPPGPYAAAVFQDVNGDGKLDTNLLGLPTEPWGFSAEARGRPGFAEAAAGSAKGALTVRLRD